MIRDSPIELSVVLPCYNGEATIADQLEALESQDWPGGWELIVVDNRSTDSSMDIVRTFSDRIPNMRIVEANERQSQPYALNVGIGEAVGTSVAFVDSDDVAGKGWLRALATTLRDAEFVASSHDTRRLNSEWLIRIRGERQANELQTTWYPPYLPHAGGCGLAARRELLGQAGGFDETLPYLHDTDLCFRLQHSGASLKLAKEAVMHVRHRDEPREMFQQARRWAQFNQLLYRRYRDAGPGPSRAWRQYLLRLGWLLRRVHRTRTLRGRQMMSWHAGWQIGLLQGSLKHRIRPAPYTSSPRSESAFAQGHHLPTQPPAQPRDAPPESSRA